jgi:hypothetical protein
MYTCKSYLAHYPSVVVKCSQCLRGKHKQKKTCRKSVKERDLDDERLANWKIEECITGNFN